MKNNPVILAFLQNMWVKNPESCRKIVERHAHEPDFWNSWVRRLLFAGGLTGKRIIKVFGKELAWEIIYDECTKEIAGDSKYCPKPDLKHIEEAIKKINPDIIITFGRVATKAVFDVTHSESCYGYQDIRFDPYEQYEHIKFLVAPHPAARQPEKINELNEVAEEIKKLLK